MSVVNRDGKELTAAAVGTGDTDSAKEVAAALAARMGRECVVVLTDSQEACSYYQRGHILVAALNILGKIENPPEIYIIWTPGHKSLAGDAAADAAAREYALRASPPGERAPIAIPRRYKDITEHYRLGRRRYPPPRAKVSREEAVPFRSLQTNSFPHGTLLHATKCFSVGSLFRQF